MNGESSAFIILIIMVYRGSRWFSMHQDGPLWFLMVRYGLDIFSRDEGMKPDIIHSHNALQSSRVITYSQGVGKKHVVMIVRCIRTEFSITRNQDLGKSTL